MNREKEIITLLEMIANKLDILIAIKKSDVVRRVTNENKGDKK